MKKEFLSQVCTTREQSKRLLQLGFNESTADCHWFYHLPTETWRIDARPYFGIGTYCPAWSLYRLIEMLPETIRGCVVVSEDFAQDMTCYLRISKKDVSYIYYDEYGSQACYEVFRGDDMYKNVIDIIEFLISEEKFDKQYIGG